LILLLIGAGDRDRDGSDDAIAANPSPTSINAAVVSTRRASPPMSLAPVFWYLIPFLVMAFLLAPDA
jgi:hypothetical protein